MLPLGLQVLLDEVDKPLKRARFKPIPRPTVSDWLESNSMTLSVAVRQLAQIEPAVAFLSKSHDNPTELSISSEEAWALCAASMRSALPNLASAINRVEALSPKCLRPSSSKHPKPFTYDLGFKNLPFVSLHYKKRPADLLAMSHEFGHGVQIVASWESGEGQMPPVARECCAFLAELALIRHCGDHFPNLYAGYLADDGVYFGENKTSLEYALQNGQTPYKYYWNYPLARHLAARLNNAGETDQACTIYRSGRDGGRILQRCLLATKAEGLAT